MIRRTKTILFVLAAGLIGLAAILGLKRETAPGREVRFAHAEDIQGVAAEACGGFLTIMGEPAPYDAETNTYYVPASDSRDSFPQALEWSGTRERAAILRDGYEKDKDAALRENHVFTLRIQTEDGVLDRKLVFTGLPMMSVETLSDDSLPADEDGTAVGKVRFFDPDGGGSGVYKVDTYYGYVRIRGSYSRNYSKVSYRVSLRDGEGSERHASLAGLGEGSDWILNPMHIDENKLRDKLCLDLWEAFHQNDPHTDRRSADFAYIELLRDGRYWGLYGLETPLTPERVRVDEDDILIKISFSSSVATVENFIAAARDLEGGDTGSSVKWPEVWRPGVWDPLVTFLTRLVEKPEEYSGEEMLALLDLDNFADYTLFILATAAEDNDLHNAYYLARPRSDGTTRMSRIPWDLNVSFGYRKSSRFNGCVLDDAELTKINMTPPGNTLMRTAPETVYALLSERYWALRDTVLSEEALLDNLAAQSAVITESGAMKREIDRWTVVNNTEDTTMLRDFITGRFQFLDDYFTGPYTPEKLEALVA